MIQLFKPVYRVKETLESIRECLEKGWTGLGYKTVEFEEAWKNYTELPHAHFLNSATSGLELALQLVKYNIEDDMQVASSPLTFIATNHSITKETGNCPVFVDVSPTSLNMSPDALEEVVDWSNIGAVVFVAIGGNVSGLSKVVRLCKKHDKYLILDASHAAGTKLEPSEIPDYIVYSFQAVKNLSVGDGGMICCKNQKDDELARQLSWHGITQNTWERTQMGRNWDYGVDWIGNKFHGNSIAAAVGLVGLKYLDEDNDRRRSVSTYYSLNLREEYNIIHQPITSSHHLFQVTVPLYRRNSIIAHAREQGVQLGVHYRTNTDYPMYAYGEDDCPVATELSSQLISLPMGTHLTNDDVEKVIEVINDAYSLA